MEKCCYTATGIRIGVNAERERERGMLNNMN
jgi:hypothetical protein